MSPGTDLSTNSTRLSILGIRLYSIREGVVSRFRFPLSTGWELLFFPVLVLTIALCTSYSDQVFKNHRKQKKKAAPTLSYKLPIFGHLLWFLWDIPGLESYIRAQYDASTPTHIRLLNRSFYLVTGQTNIREVWRHTKSLSTKPQKLFGLRRIFATPKHAMKIYEADDSGISPSPLAGSTTPPDKRIFFHNHVMVDRFMSGSHLLRMSHAFQNNLTEHLIKSDIRSDWTEFPSLFKFMQVELLQASVNSLCGPRFLELNPRFAEYFWEFDRTVPILIKGYPRWLWPTPHRMRDECIASVKRWLESLGSEHFTDDAGNASVDAKLSEPEEIMKTRHRFLTKLTGFGLDGMAANDLGLIWGMNTNSVPAAFWFILEAAKDAALLQRLRNEAYDSVSVWTPNGPLFDVEKLSSQPLLQSVYAEVFRLRVAIFLQRVVLDPTTEVGGVEISQGDTIIISNYTVQRNKHAWGVDIPRSERLETFWAERFLMDAGSRENATTADTRDPTPVAPEKRNVKFSLSGLSDAWIPYGGGENLCPGRHFAKHEILLAFAVICLLFDIEILPGAGFNPQPDMTYYGKGAMAPKVPTRFRIRRRKFG